MRSVLLAGVAATLLAAAPAASADSFAINEYSTRDLGLANAGRATQRGDAAAAWGNPALIAALRRGTITGATRTRWSTTTLRSNPGWTSRTKAVSAGGRFLVIFRGAPFGERRFVDQHINAECRMQNAEFKM